MRSAALQVIAGPRGRGRRDGDRANAVPRISRMTLSRSVRAASTRPLAASAGRSMAVCRPSPAWKMPVMTASSSSACSCSAVTAFRAGSAGSAAARRGPGRRSIPRFVREASRPPAGQTTPPDRGARARPRLRRARSESTSMTVHVGYDRYIAELTLIRIGPGMARPPRVQSDAVPALSRGLCRTFADTPCARPYSPAAGSDSCRPVNSCRREGRHRVTGRLSLP